MDNCGRDVFYAVEITLGLLLKSAVSLRWILRFLSGARLEYRPYLFLSQQLSSVVQGWSTDHFIFITTNIQN